MSLVSFSDSLGQISLYQNFQLQWQYIKIKVLNTDRRWREGDMLIVK